MLKGINLEKVSDKIKRQLRDGLIAFPYLDKV